MSFFNSPDKFSFKDLLALAFQVPFFYVVWRALTSGQCLEVLQVLVPLEGAIFGGYFIQEAVPAVKSAWLVRSYYPTRNNDLQTSLNGVAPEVIAPADIPEKTNY